MPEVDVIVGCRGHCQRNGDVVLVECAWQSHWAFYLIGLPEFPQDATFLSRKALLKNIPLDERFNFAFDTAFYFKILREKPKLVFLDAVLSSIRVYPEMKTLRDDARKKIENVLLLSEYQPKTIAVKLILRLLRTRLHAIVSTLLQMWLGKTNTIRILKFDPANEQWGAFRIY